MSETSGPNRADLGQPDEGDNVTTSSDSGPLDVILTIVVVEIYSARTDFAHSIAGLRVNEWISVLALVVAIGFVATGRSQRRSETDSPETFEPLVDVNE